VYRLLQVFFTQTQRQIIVGVRVGKNRTFIEHYYLPSAQENYTGRRNHKTVAVSDKMPRHMSVHLQYIRTECGYPCTDLCEILYYGILTTIRQDIPFLETK
jgi:hypothetical protein